MLIGIFTVIRSWELYFPSSSFAVKLASALVSSKLKRSLYPTVLNVNIARSNMAISFFKAPQYKFFWKARNYFSLKRMFVEIVAFTLKYRQLIYKLIGKGRNRIKPYSKEFKTWKIPVFYIINTIRRPFNGCKFPHKRRL